MTVQTSIELQDHLWKPRSIDYQSETMFHNISMHTLFTILFFSSSNKKNGYYKITQKTPDMKLSFLQMEETFSQPQQCNM